MVLCDYSQTEIHALVPARDPTAGLERLLLSSSCGRPTSETVLEARRRPRTALYPSLDESGPARRKCVRRTLAFVLRGRRLPQNHIANDDAVRGGSNECREPRRINLPYYVERIVPTDSAAIIIGTAAPFTLHFLRIDPSSKSPLSGHFGLENASAEEYERDRFVSGPLGSNRELLAIPGSGYDRADSTHWVQGSTNVVFVRTSPRGLVRLGSLSTTGTPEADSLEVQSGWFDDWYANARGVFVGERIFALIGYELIEARIMDGRVVERQRINFMPGIDQKGWQ